MSEPFITTHGARIGYSDRGTGTTTFVFLHYWGGSLRTWSRVMAELEGNARCIALDQRGWGRSDALDGRYDLEALADDVEAVVTTLELGSYVLVGHSMGGKVAQILAARGARLLEGLVLVAPAPPEPMPVPMEQREAMLASYGSREGVEQALTMLAGRPLSSAEHAQVMSDTLGGAPGAKQAWTRQGMVATVSERLRDFSGPVRVIVGELDRVEQPDALRAVFAKYLPQAVVETVPGVGHLLPIENPGAVAAACHAMASELASCLDNAG